MPEPIKRHNHFVPEMYLKNWATKNKVNTYSLLVPHENVPIWKEKSIEYSASIDNLYVRHDDGMEVDDFENEFMRRYETPAKAPLEKATNEQRLTSDDWQVLIDYIAAQIVRTPAFYLKSQNHMKELIPEAIETVAKEINSLIPDQIKRQNRTVPDDEIILPITVDFTGIKADDRSQFVKITAVAGKTTWLFSMKHLLTNVAPVLHRYKWSIVSPEEGICWPTSDDPVICLNYYGDRHYDFNGGWGKKGSEIFMPISPTKVIYTQIGVKHPPRMVFNRDESLLIKKLIVEHAFMNVYAYDKDEDIPLIRPRTVNLEEYKRIKTEFEEWYGKYQNDEVPYLNPNFIQHKNDTADAQ